MIIKKYNTFFVGLVFLTFFSFIFLNKARAFGKSEKIAQGDLKSLSFSISHPKKKIKIFYEIHSFENQLPFAQKIKEVLEYVTIPLIDYFAFAPKDSVHFIIKSDADSANGSATPFPRNLIELYDFPPLESGQLSANPNWIEALVLHELIHAFHLDKTSGFLKVVRSIFGSIGKLGGLAPRWFTEGIATWGESKFTGRGRLYSYLVQDSIAELIMRKDFCQSADCLDFPGDYPKLSL